MWADQRGPGGRVGVLGDEWALWAQARGTDSLSFLLGKRTATL